MLDFTDILARRDLQPHDRNRLYERVRTPEMWDTERYLDELIALGFKIRRVEDWSEHVAASYAWAREQAIANREELETTVGDELVQDTLDGLGFWVDMAERGNVGWVFIVAQIPAYRVSEASSQDRRQVVGRPRCVCRRMGSRRVMYRLCANAVGGCGDGDPGPRPGPHTGLDVGAEPASQSGRIPGRRLWLPVDLRRDRGVGRPARSDGSRLL